MGCLYSGELYARLGSIHTIHVFCNCHRYQSLRKVKFYLQLDFWHKKVPQSRDVLNPEAELLTHGHHNGVKQNNSIQNATPFDIYVLKYLIVFVFVILLAIKPHQRHNFLLGRHTEPVCLYCVDIAFLLHLYLYLLYLYLYL